MKPIFEFEIPGKPCGKGRPRFTRNGHTFTPEQTVNYENLVKLTFRGAYPEAEPLSKDSTLYADIRAFFPIPQSASKKKHALMMDGTIRPTTKPDADNIAKIVLDSLNGIAYHDDAQIIVLRVEKFYSVSPRVAVQIGTLNTEHA